MLPLQKHIKIIDFCGCLITTFMLEVDCFYSSSNKIFCFSFTWFAGTVAVVDRFKPVELSGY
jgi:hypothetical protein